MVFARESCRLECSQPRREDSRFVGSRAEGQGYSGPSEPRRFHYEPQMLNAGLQDLVFALLCLGFVWAGLRGACPHSPLLPWKCELCHFSLEVYDSFCCFFFLILQALKVQNFFLSLKSIWTSKSYGNV